MNYYVRKGESKRFENEISFGFERENYFKKAFTSVCVRCSFGVWFSRAQMGKEKRRICEEGSHISSICIVYMYYTIALGSHSRTHTFIRNPMVYIKYRWQRERNVFEQEEYPVFLWLCTVRPSCRYVLHTFKGSHASTDVCVCVLLLMYVCYIGLGNDRACCCCCCCHCSLYTSILLPSHMNGGAVWCAVLRLTPCV